MPQPCHRGSGRGPRVSCPRCTRPPAAPGHPWLRTPPWQHGDAVGMVWHLEPHLTAYWSGTHRSSGATCDNLRAWGVCLSWMLPPGTSRKCDSRLLGRVVGQYLHGFQPQAVISRRPAFSNQAGPQKKKPPGQYSGYITRAHAPTSSHVRWFGCNVRAATTFAISHRQKTKRARREVGGVRLCRNGSVRA